MTVVKAQTPGEARASGPSVADTLASDRHPPPPPLLESRYEFLGDADIPFERYTSQAYAMRSLEPRALSPIPRPSLCPRRHQTPSL